MAYPDRPDWCPVKYWNRFVGSWSFQRKYDREFFEINRHGNHVIGSLYMNVAVDQYNRFRTAHVFCDKAQSRDWIDDKDVPIHYGFDRGKITPQAIVIIRDRVREWTEQDEPKPEPEPEPEPSPVPEPDPIDEGGGILDGIGDTLKGWIAELIKGMTAILDVVITKVNSSIGLVQSLISKIETSIVGAVEKLIAETVARFEQFTDKIKEVYDRVYGVIETVYLTVKDAVENIAQGIKEAITVVVEWIKGTFTELWEKIKKGLEWIGDRIVEGIKYLWDKIKDALDWTWETLKSAYEAIKTALTTVWDRTKQRLTETIESIKDGFGDFIDRLIAFFTLIWDKITDILDGILNVPEEIMVKTGVTVLKVQERIIKEFQKEMEGA